MKAPACTVTLSRDIKHRRGIHRGRKHRAQGMSAHALALLPLTPSRPPPAAEAEAAGLLLLLLPLLLLLLLTIALRQPPAEDECELQNESYVSIVLLCVPVPTADVTGPGAVGMSNVFDGRNDEREAGECGCVDADGGGFCRGAGAGECIRLDAGGGADVGERAGADAAGDTSGGVEADVGAGAGVGVGEGEEGCVWTSDGKVAWGSGGKVSREADMSDGCTAAGYGGDVN
jgi:hypothetical protein